MQQVSQEIIEKISERSITTEKELEKLIAEISGKYKLKHTPKKIHLLLHANKEQRQQHSQNHRPDSELIEHQNPLRFRRRGFWII